MTRKPIRLALSNDRNREPGAATSAADSIGAPPSLATVNFDDREEASRAEWKGIEKRLRESEEKYRLLIENASESIFLVQDGVIRWPNPKMTQFSGYESDELASMPYTRIVAPEDRELVRDRHERRIRGETVPNQYQFRMLRKNGTSVWIEINVVKIDWEGHPATLCFVRDIEEQKKAQEALRDSQALYHSLVESLPLVIFRKDLDGRFTFGNCHFCDLIGRPLDQIVGHDEHDFSPAGLAEKYRQDDQRVCQSGVTLEDIEERLGPDGRTMYVQVLKTPVFDAQNRIIGTQGILWDVTTRKRAEEALERARETAERENLHARSDRNQRSRAAADQP